MMTVKKLIIILAVLFVVVGTGTTAVLLTRDEHVAVRQSPVPATPPSTTTTSAPAADAPRADYLYVLVQHLVLMRGTEVVARVPRVFDTGDFHQNKVIWTNAGDFVAVLSDAALRQQRSETVELISINTRTGAQQRLPCPNCSDITGVGPDGILAAARFYQSNDEYRLFDLRSGEPPAAFDFPSPNLSGSFRTFLGSTRDRVITQQQRAGRSIDGQTQELKMVGIGSVIGKDIGYYGSNSYLPFASFEGASGQKFAVASNVNPGGCGAEFPISVFDGNGKATPTDMSSAFPPRSTPGSSSGVEVHDLWWTPSGELRATITSWTCEDIKPHGGGQKELHTPPSLWELEGTKWVRGDLSPATVVREVSDGARMVLVVPDCIGKVTVPEEDVGVHCNTGQLFRDHGSSRALVAEGVLSILTPPVSNPGAATDTRSLEPPPVDTPAVSPFVGTWYQHGGNVIVSADGTVRMSYQVTTVAPAAFPELTLKISGVTGTKATATVVTSDDTALPPGSTITFELRDPGLVATTVTGTTSKWCDAAHKASGACGA
jgi:hypothetical protein